MDMGHAELISVYEDARASVEASLRDGHFEAFVRPDGQPGLRLTGSGEAAGVDRPLSQGPDERTF